MVKSGKRRSVERHNWFGNVWDGAILPTIFDQRGTIERPWPKLRRGGLVERFRTAVAYVGLTDMRAQAEVTGAEDRHVGAVRNSNKNGAPYAASEQ